MAANYKKRTITQTTYDYKKHYDDVNIYVVIQTKNFSIRCGETKPSFVCYLKQLGDQFGDPLPYVIAEGEKVLFRSEGATGATILSGEMTQTDTYLGEWVYTFTALDYSEPGKYTSYIVLVGADGSESTLKQFTVNVR